MSRQQISTLTSQKLLSNIISALSNGSYEALEEANECKEEIYMRKNLKNIKAAEYLFDVIRGHTD